MPVHFKALCDLDSGVDLLASDEVCATKRTDTMDGNSRRLYQGGCEPLGRSG